MGLLSRLCCFLIIFDISIATPIVILSVNNTDHQLQDKNLQAQIEIVRINTGSITNDNLDNFRARLTTLEGLFKKLKANSSSNNETTHDTISVAKSFEEIEMPTDEPEQREISTISQPKCTADSTETVEISKIVQEVYMSSANNFVLLINLSSGLSDTYHSFKILQTLYSIMRENSDQDPTKLTKLAKMFRDKVLTDTNITNDMKTNITNTIEELEDIIKVTAPEFLSRAMHSGDYPMKTNALSFKKELYDFRPSLYNEVFQKMLDTTYTKVKSYEILENIVDSSNTAQAILGLRALLSKIKTSGDLDENVVLRLASELSKVKLNNDFKNLDEDFMENVFNAAVNDLPTCSRNLYFKPTICLWNMEQNSYLLAGNALFNYDSERRNIFAAPGVSKNPGAVWNAIDVGEQFHFKSVKYNDFLYAENNNYARNYHERYVFNWIPNEPSYNMEMDQKAWTIALVGDNCYLKNSAYNEYLFASDEHYLDFDYTHVFTSVADHGGRIWQIQDCSY